MHGVFGQNTPQSNRLAAEFCSQKIPEAKRKKFFRVVAKHAFPSKTVPALHALTGYSERAIYDWLSGKSEAPSGVMLALFGEIARH